MSRGLKNKEPNLLIVGEATCFPHAISSEQDCYVTILSLLCQYTSDQMAVTIVEVA